ncbi:MAG TPA: TIGR01777 family oxidoreductase [Candidatus Baltobacteraceae bacterium]|jgi:hypothetical protein
MIVAILGASGFVGGHLAAALAARGDEVRALSLHDPDAAAARADGCDVVVNLAGASIAQKWSDEVKREILESRTVLPQRFLDALAKQTRIPRAYVSASATGYYGYSADATFTESDGPGSDFLADVCARWEATARNAHDLGMRVACVRSGIALARDGGALAKILPPFKMGAGGIIGNGKQWFSWIHIDDVVGIYLLAIDGAEGALNATAPNPVTNADFTKALGEAIHRPTFLPVPTFALRAMLGEGADALLNGQRVIPKRTQELGYAFAYPTIESALANVLA